MNTYIPPKAGEHKFSCPHCGAIALQRWQVSSWNLGTQLSSPDENPIRVAKCDHCGKRSLWFDGTMVYPDMGTAPQPNPDTPESVKGIYREAASIATKSPRGAAALLRLAVQVLCKELGEKGENINDDIAALVKKGLPERVQQALDIVRVTGNHAVHPGQIDVDDPTVVGRLFDLINVIVEYTVSMPNRISSLYSALPPNAVHHIRKRDQKP